MTTLLLALDADAVSSAQLARLYELAVGARVVLTDRRDEMEALLPDLGIAAAYFPPELTLEAPCLKWFQQWAAGADWLLRHPEAVERPFVLTNVSGIHAIPMSEHVLALMLAFARGLPSSLRAQQRGEWMSHRDWDLGVFEMAGRTVLLLGLGPVGVRTARIAGALGMRVIGVRRNPDTDMPGLDAVIGPQRLHEAIPEADFVVLALPLTPETKRIIGARELQLMKRSAYLINVGRGETVDESALIGALRDGRIAGAGLDVFEEEPLPEDSPLWGMDNVMITTHYAGSTPHYNERAMAIFLDNLQRYRQREPLRNVVDKRLGY